MSRFEMYKDSAGEFRWRFIASNGKIIATCGEGYVNKADCQHGIELIQRDSSSADVEEKADE